MSYYLLGLFDFYIKFFSLSFQEFFKGETLYKYLLWEILAHDIWNFLFFTIVIGNYEVIEREILHK